jgi:hypothetical protein
MFGKNVSSEMNVEIGRASGRESVEIAVVAVSSKTESDNKKANEHEKAMHNYK